MDAGSIGLLEVRMASRDADDVDGDVMSAGRLDRTGVTEGSVHGSYAPREEIRRSQK